MLVSAAGETIARWDAPLATMAMGNAHAKWLRGGEVFVSIGGEHLEFRDAATGDFVLTGGEPRRHACPSMITSFDVDAFERRLVTGHPAERAHVWDLRTGELLDTLEAVPDFGNDPEDEVAEVRFEPEGPRVALSTRRGSHVLVYDAEELETVWVSEFIGAHFWEPLPVRWDPEAEYVWFAFQCGSGPLLRVDPASPSAEGSGTTGRSSGGGQAAYPGWETVLDEGHVPRFAEGLTVVQVGRMLVRL